MAGSGDLRSLRIGRCPADPRFLIRERIPVHLFVYGTLRRAAAHPMHVPLCAAASFVGPARVRGVLVWAGEHPSHYPGVVLDARAGWVIGELYHLRDRTVLERLDAYEEAGPTYPEPQEFRRVQTTVERLDGGTEVGWIYEYGWPIAGLEVIASGDFLRADRRGSG